MTVHTDIPETTSVNGIEYVNFPQGAKRTHNINVLDADGNPQNMSGWSLAYVWRDALGNLVVNKATGSGITIGNGAGTNDRASVTLEAADTVALTQILGRETQGALWRTDGTNDDPLATFTVWLSPVAAQP